MSDLNHEPVSIPAGSFDAHELQKALDAANAAGADRDARVAAAIAGTNKTAALIDEGIAARAVAEAITEAVEDGVLSGSDEAENETAEDQTIAGTSTRGRAKAK